MSPSPRNQTVGFLLSFLEELGFVLRLEDDGMWVAQRSSGMMVRTLMFPDDPVVPKELVIASFWRQAAEIRDEIADALREMAAQIEDLKASED